MNSLLLTDFYKVGHKFQYPKNTQLVYSNFTARTSRIKNVNHIVFFGLQYFIKKYLLKEFQDNFFNKTIDEVIKDYSRIIKNCLGSDLQNYSHITALHELGYLPIEIKALPEGSIIPIKIPMLTIVNTIRDEKYSWITNWLETLLSTMLWQPINSATIANEYKKILTRYALDTGADKEFIKFQGHDFSFRGMGSLESAITSGMAHLTNFVGTDSIPAILELEKYYNCSTDNELVGCSVPATEHSVMCAGGNESELETFKRLINDIYPTGIISIVSDTWDLWKVCTEYLTILKNDVLVRNGKVVIRPDSGNPVQIICGNIESADIREQKGVVELLWDIFGGSINDKGYKVLDSHIGAIYGDSITLDRAEHICKQLQAKGFASSNIVFGIGSYTYQYNTRDTFGMAMKATYVEIEGKGFNIYKNPITDDGTKKSATGLLKVERVNNEFILKERVNFDDERLSELKTVFKNGKLIQDFSLNQIRNTMNNEG